jgi:transcription antitermination factor NusA-like protein
MVDTLQAHFIMISEIFRIQVSENTTKYVDIIRMISSIPSLKVGVSLRPMGRGPVGAYCG